MTTQKQQLAAAALPRVEPRAPPARPRRRHNTVTALRQGPGLRRLLGSAAELWELLQLRARKHAAHTLTVTAAELSLAHRPPRPQRTVEWGLRRLADAGLIDKRRTRYGTVITLLAWDVDENGVPEYSPDLPAPTFTWMRTQRPRGRPRIQKKPTASKAAEENVFMQSSAAQLSLEDHPLVPPSPYTRDMDLPRIPFPHMLDKHARISANREFLIETYTAASRVFYPRIAVQSASKFMRGHDGCKVLDAAAALFIEHGIAPQAWVGEQFERAIKIKRKAPPRPEIVYEPTFVEQHAGHHLSTISESRYYTRVVADLPDYREFTHGMRQLCALWQKTMKELRHLDVVSDAEIERVVARYWPEGYLAIYRSAEEKMRAIQNELDTRVARGAFVWGA